MVIFAVGRRTIRRYAQAAIMVILLILLAWGVLAMIWRLLPPLTPDERWRDRPLPEQPLRVGVSWQWYG